MPAKTPRELSWAMPKVSQEHLDAPRDQILEGARRAFARYGYEGATVARLEEETGLSRGAIFNYFPDKWSLFFELAARDQHELLTMLVDDGLDATLRHLTTENPDWLAVLHRDHAPPADESRADEGVPAARRLGARPARLGAIQGALRRGDVSRGRLP